MKLPQTLSALILLTPFLGAEVVISELSGATSDRLLQYSSSGVPSLGPGVPWFSMPFDDSSWSVAPAPLGYGYGDVATNLSSRLQGKAPSCYLRRSFQASAAQAASLADLILTTEFDDGLLVFLNGVEVARCHLGAPGMFIFSDQVAFNENSTHGSPALLNLGVASELLIEGENVLAIQVVNRDIASALIFDASLRIDAGVTLINVTDDDFANANGAFKTHRNLNGSITDSTSGSPLVNGWLARSPLVRSGAGWTNLEIRSVSDAGAGEEGDGAISYTLTSSDPLAPAVIAFPPVSMATHWTPGSVTAANLSETRMFFRYKGDANTAFDFHAESPDGSVALAGFPIVAATNDETLGYWRFDEAGAANGSSIATAIDRSGKGRNALPSGSGAGTYSTDVPGNLIFDPLANTSRSNQFSMNASAASERLMVPNSAELNTSFTVEMFIKIDEEPAGFNAFLRRLSGNGSRWQIDFDHSANGAFGRLRTRLDTPDGDNTNFVLGPIGGASIPANHRIWIDTDSGNGQVSGYNDPTDWARDGDGFNDRPGWHHVALSIDENTGTVKFYYDYELIQTRTLVDQNGSGYEHPDAVIEFGKFGSSYGLLLDEVRYTGRPLDPDEFLQVIENNAEVWSTYVIDLGQGDPAERAALLNHLNANNLTSIVPALRLREESYSPTGKTITLDSFRVDHAGGGASAQLLNSGSDWKYHPGTAEPSGGVYEPATPGVERAEFVDWIELSNTGSSPVDLTAWSLSDRASDPRKWTFPAGTMIPANGHLVILADDLETTNFTPEFLHANFKLSRSGEYLGLVDETGSLRSQFASGFPRQLDFHSYGLRPGGTDYVYLSEPTPGRPNAGPAFLGEVAKPDFNLPGGFYPAAITLAMTADTPGSTIRYTTDGSEPTLENGLDYAGPLSLARIDARTAHALRARAFADGFIPSRVKSASYLIGQSANLTQAPAMLFTGDAERTFTAPYGVLTIAGGTYVDGIWQATGKDDYNMSLERGRAFERPAFIEFYLANSTLGFREDAGLRMSASNFSRPRMILDGIEESPWAINPRDKPSFNLYFRDEYEDSSITFPIFGEDYPVDTFEQLRPRAGKNDINNPHIKDEVMRRLFIEMGNVGSRGIFNSLYVNGDWKGFYNTCERLREPFFQAHYPNSEEWDVLQAGNPDGGLAEGDLVAWDTLNTRLQATNVNSRTNWESALELVDPIAMADYFLLNIYGATWDWPQNNWVSARERSSAGRFRFYVWDAEGAFGHPRRTGNNNSTKPVNYNTISEDLLAQSDSTSQMFQRLQRWPEFRLILADRIHKHFFNRGTLDDSTPSTSRVKKVIDTAVTEFSPLLAERSSESVDTEFWRYWSAAGSSRRSYLLGPNEEHFRDAGYWPNTAPPSYNQHGGEVSQGFQLIISSGAGTVYYSLDGSDPREFGNAIRPGALSYHAPIALPQSVVTVKSRLRSPGGEWSALTEAEFKVGLVPPSPTNLVISEIHYHPGFPNTTEVAAGFLNADDFEFLRLHNIGNQTLDLSSLSFTAGIAFDFQSSLVTSLAPGASVIIVRSIDAFRLRYGPSFDSLVAGQYSGGLANGGERLTLEIPGTVIRDFIYDDASPWPKCADGDGLSLILLNPSTNPNHALPSSWAGSAQVGGLPGGQPRALTYAAWQGLALAAGQASGPNADPDGDGLPNLVEFFLGSLPGKSDAATHAPVAALVAQNGETYLTFTFSEVANQIALQGIVEVSDGLGTWSSAVSDIAEVLPAMDSGNGSSRRTFRVTRPVSDHAKYFVRLRVLQN